MSDKIVIRCDTCSGQFRIDSRFTGKTIRCPECGAPVEVSAPVSAAAPVAAAPPPPGRGGSSASVPVPAAAPTRSRRPISRNAGGPASSRDGSSPTSTRRDARRASVRREPDAGRTRRRPTSLRDDRDAPRGTRGRGKPGHGVPVGSGGSKAPLIITIASVSLVLLIAVVVALTSGGDDGGTNTAADPGAGNDGANNAEHAATAAAQALSRFNEHWEGFSSSYERRESLVGWLAHAKEHEGQFRDVWLARFETTLAESMRDANAEQGVTAKVRALNAVGQWTVKCERPEAGKAAWDGVLDLQPEDPVANAAVGNRLFELPKDEEIQRMDFESLFDPIELDPYVGRWLTPEEYAEAERVLDEQLSQARATLAEWAANPFNKLAHEELQRLRRLTTFEHVEFEVFQAEPFIVLLTLEGNAGHRFEARKEERADMLQQTWQAFLGLVDDWELTSSMAEKGDTLEDPIPFVFVSFGSRESYDEYQNSFDRQLGAYTRAFYDPNNRTVNYYEDEEEGDWAQMVVIHETLHQLMDRFAPNGVHGFTNHCFAEGYPDYFSAHTRRGGQIQFGQLNETRGEELRSMRTIFDAGARPRPGAMGDEDWMLFDIPMLLTMRDQFWVYVGGVDQIRQPYFETPAYQNDPAAFELLLDDEAMNAIFYSYAWAFTYWLNQEYPDEYREFATMAMNGTRGAEAEVFMDAFGINGPSMPQMGPICGELNIHLRNSEARRMQALDVWHTRLDTVRAIPEIQQMQREFTAWMAETFPPYPQADPVDRLADIRDDLLDAARLAVGGGRYLAEFRFMVLMLVGSGIPIDAINEILAEEFLYFDNEDGAVIELPH